MCLNPVTITNPGYRKNQYASQHGNLVQVPSAIRPKAEKIEVPCGKCVECRAARYNAVLQRSLVESMTAYMFFVTLTYDNDHIPSLKFPDGTQIYFANYEDIILMFKRLRDANVLDRDFRYLCVNEYGDKTNRPHFHVIIYVARLATDNQTTPYWIEKTLYDNLKKFYAVNKGTRKDPVYEPLFTYITYMKDGKQRSNYEVKYVEPSNKVREMTEFLIPDLATVKTTRYLTGYVQKPNNFDASVDKYLLKYKDDPILLKKLRALYRGQIRYSKGFGCGFVNGKKYYLPRISVRCSSNAIFYSDLVKNLPVSYQEFCDLYPDLSVELDKFRNYDIYRRYRKLTFKKCLSMMTTDQYMYHCMYVHYFKKEFTLRYKNYFKREKNTQATVSYYYHYSHRNSYYAPPTVTTTKPEDSPVYKFLRKGVEEGIASKVPYLAFKMVGQQKFTALCRYYKERVCTIEDTERMFKAVGVSSYEEWQNLFVKQKNNRTATLYSGNQAKYFNPHKKIVQNTCKSQKNCLYLRQYEEEGIYRYLLTNKKDLRINV